MKSPLPIKNFSLLLLGVALLASCREDRHHTLFTSLPKTETFIDFSNTLTQTAHFNIIEYLYFYNGGGVSAGDINNDGLIDLYFTANQLQNRLYLNKGGFVFEDITERAGVAGEGNWKTGSTMADVNGDGLLDIFVCGVGNYKSFNGRNQLFINNGDLTFSDATQEYGLSFQGLSTHAAFLDYDNDGDLDMYLLNHSVHSVRSYANANVRYEKDSLAGDRLYRNDLIPMGKKGFTNVTSAAGILSSQVAYGLGVGVSDVNLDGYADIYVSNDFHENDYLYINQRNGTFKESLTGSLPHTSRFSMGNDIADINNDGLPDIVTLDMLPADEEVIKTTAGEDSYDIYSYKLQLGYHHQFARNTLQLNRGIDQNNEVLFSDIAPLAGFEATDWSWGPLLADFDNDGRKDLFIANGIVGRPNDLDYINFVSTDSAQRFSDYKEFIRKMPSGSVPNFMFRNEGDYKFSDASAEWIGTKPTVSTGAVYADLDNDGDLDLAVNNINEEAGIFRNDNPPDSGGWIQIELHGEGVNRYGIGTKIIVYSGDNSFHCEQNLSRGWQSSVSPMVHIGIGNVPSIDSIRIIWPDQRAQLIRGQKSNVRMKVHQRDANSFWTDRRDDAGLQRLLTSHVAPHFTHRENSFNAFDRERLIPHMLSTQGPPLSKVDLNGDGLDDFFIGGGAGQSARIFLQEKNGNFIPDKQHDLEADSIYEDTGSLFFDATGDGKPDLIVTSGGQEFTARDPRLRPRLYVNDGKGSLHRAGNFPEVFANASCVKAGDFDADGDADVFIGGRVISGEYGADPESFLLVNDGEGNFSDESTRLNASTKNNRIGLVTEGVWADINNDKRLDLIVVGEWMPITVLLQNASGSFADKTVEYGLDETNGWWNTLLPADIDKDGDLDFLAGNLGTNSRLRAAPERPITLYVGDIDGNGGTDHLLTYFNGAQQYPFISRDQLVRQVPSFKRKYLKYNNFKNVRREHLIPENQVGQFSVKTAYCFSSVYLENQNGKLLLRLLPVEAQMFPVFAFETGDFNHDGITDLLAVGNLDAVQPEFGRYDGGYGLMMLGDSTGSFKALSFMQSGFLVKGQGRSIGRLRSADGKSIYIVARNNDSLVTFR